MTLNKIGIGVDIGGSHITCSAVDLHTNTLVETLHSHANVDHKAPADEILSVWAKALGAIIGKSGISHLAGISFAMPGPFDYVNGIGLFEKNEKYPHLKDVNIRQSLRDLLELPASLPLRFINDATAFAVSEAWIGVGKGYPRIIAITLGTGFGSAFLAEGLPVLEGENVPENGCAWHLPFKNGIADEYFSTRWFERSYAERTGKTITGARFVADNYHTDQDAKALMDEYGYNLGTFLSPLIRQFKADHIVMGGNISAAFPLFSTAMNNVFTTESIQIGVSLSVLKENAAVLGSVRLINNEYYEKILPLLSLM